MPQDRPVRRILVVDDDDAIRESLSSVLTTDGHEVVGARDRGEALGPVVGDLRMPDVDGPSLYETSRTRHHFPVRLATRLPRVTFMTGNAAEHAEFPGGTTDPDPILEKPFPLRVIREMVGVLLTAAS